MERSPPPAFAAAQHHQGSHPLRMQVSLFLAFLLPCVGMSAVFAVYVCLLWYASARSSSSSAAQVAAEKKKVEKGLTAVELEKLPRATAGGGGAECAVCLDEIQVGQTVRSLPGCHHGFHLECADEWLKKHSACPLCRAKPLIPATAETDSNLDAVNLC